MQLGMVGLGRMGSNLVRRLPAAGHECVVYDLNADTVTQLAGEGATGVGSLDELGAALHTPRAVWVRVPAGQITEQTVSELGELMAAGDTIIDGGNSYYRDDIARAATLSRKDIHYVDVGTSGGVCGLERGYSLMIGGDEQAVQRLVPLFEAIAPGVDAAPRTPGRTGEPSSAEPGYLHCGPNGAGHFGAAARRSPRSRRDPPHPCCRPRCSPASAPAGSITLPTGRLGDAQPVRRPRREAGPMTTRPEI